MIRDDGWVQHCIWEHSQTVRELYERRCRLEAEEMTCAIQAVDLLAERCAPGDTVLDVGCGSGYFYHSIRNRGLDVEYWGIDSAPSLIEIGRSIMPSYGLDPDRLRVLRIEDLAGEADHVICINVLSNIDNYHRPLERILSVAKKSVIIRESISNQSEYRYVKDEYLDEDVDLFVHVNTYDRSEIVEFISERGFEAQCLLDRRTEGRPEMVIDYPHHWQFIEARRFEKFEVEAA